MGWAEHTIWWHVYPLGFVGAPIRDASPSAEPRLRRMLNWLDYAVDLGASGLLLGPIFASETHGYDSTDQFRIDPRLGTERDFDDLVAACRERGLRIILDGVFSHVGAGHPTFLQALAAGPLHDAAALYDIDWDAEGGPAARVFEGHGSLVRLKHESPATVDYVRRVMEHWLARGVDGWRLDAAYSVPPEFWARVLPDVRAEYPEAWILGEVLHGDYAEFVTESGVDSVTQYELWKAIWSSLKDGNLYELDWSLQRNNGFLETFVPQTFVGNHDVTRIASMVGQEHAVVALAILMAVGGIPSIYSGDERGFVGVKEERLGGDDAVRPEFPETPAGLSAAGAEIFHAHQQLIALRRQHPWLTAATTEALSLENERAVWRSSAGDQHIDLAIDLTDAPSATIRDASGAVLWSRP